MLRKAYPVLLTGAALLAALAMAEVVVRFTPFFPYRSFRVDHPFGACTMREYGLGYPQSAGCRERQTTLWGGRELRASILTKNAAGFRITPAATHEHSQKRALFFGCSVVEGGGLEDSEALPNQFALRASGVEVENFAVSGMGPAQTLEMLGRDIFGGSDGRATGIFGFGNWQIPRVTGAPSVTCGWGRHFSRYGIDAQGKLTRLGELGDVCPVPRWLLPLTSRSALWRYLSGRSMAEPSDRDLDLVAAVLAESREAFARRFGSGDFFVLLYPGPAPVVEGLMRRLRARGVRFIDYSAFAGYETLPDGHPTPATNQRLAEALLRDLPSLREMRTAKVRRNFSRVPGIIRGMP